MINCLAGAVAAYATDVHEVSGSIPDQMLDDL